MKNKRRFQTEATYNTLQQARVDYDKMKIYGATVMLQDVEALGHGFLSDQKTLELTRDLANKAPYGIDMRFGHPGISENAMGKKVAESNNYYLSSEGRNRLLCDITLLEMAELSPVFTRDPRPYILSAAEKSPRKIGLSVVVRGSAVWITPDGQEFDAYEYERPENATSEMPYLRPEALYFTDFVSEGAFTHDGLFERLMFSGTTSQYADQAFDLLDEWRENYGVKLEDVVKKGNRLLSQYVESRKMAKPRKLEANEENGLPAPDEIFEPDEDETVEDESTETSEDEFEAALEQAEMLNAALEQQVEQAAAQDTQAIQELRAKVSEFGIEIGKLKKHAQNMSNALALVVKRLAALESEPVVTRQVGGAKVSLGARMPSRLPNALVNNSPAPNPVVASMRRQKELMSEVGIDTLLNKG